MAEPMQMAPEGRRMKQYGQRMKTACWLMCLRMMSPYKGWDEPEIGKKLTDVGIDMDSARKKTGLLTRDCMKAAKALGLHPAGAGQSWGAYRFGRWLTLGPVWVAGRWTPGYPHTVVVIGAIMNFASMKDVCG